MQPSGLLLPGKDESTPGHDRDSYVMENHKTQTPSRDLLLSDLEEQGWRCEFIRIDTGSESVFALEAHRNGVDHIIISDRLLPALVELYNSLLRPSIQSD